MLDGLIETSYLSVLIIYKPLIILKTILKNLFGYISTITLNIKKTNKYNVILYLFYLDKFLSLHYFSIVL